MTRKILIIVGLIVTLGVAFYYFGQRRALGEQVSYHAKIKTLSTSGSMAFYYYDPEKDQVECDREDCWFWGTLRQAENDQKALDYFKFLSDREDHVFKITGVREADDCEYLEGKCLQNIVLDKVEAIEAL